MLAYSQTLNWQVVQCLFD